MLVTSKQSPRSFNDCIDCKTGRVLQNKLRAYHDAVEQSIVDLVFADDIEMAVLTPPAKKRRAKRGLVACCYDETTDTYRPLSPLESCWYRLYVSRDPMTVTKSFLAKFRRRFHLPNQEFLNLVEDARTGNWFPPWSKEEAIDAFGRPSLPLELMILGSLRFLGRGWTFDDLSEATGISEETHRRFFHDFIKIGSTVLYHRHVTTPTTAAAAQHHMHEFSLAGCNGAVGSMDATHVILEKCANRLRNAHLCRIVSSSIVGWCSGNTGWCRADCRADWCRGSTGSSSRRSICWWIFDWSSYALLHNR